jgi:acyl dehydratase
VTASGLCLEDFASAPSIDSRTRTVTAADVTAFAALTGDHNPLHTDEDVARAAGFPGVIVHGMLGLALAVGLIEETGVHDGTTLAMLEVQHWAFRRPVLTGRQVHARMTVTGTYPSTRDRRRGVLVRHLALLGDDQEVLQEGSITLLVRTREAQSSRLDAPDGG